MRLLLFPTNTRLKGTASLELCVCLWNAVIKHSFQRRMLGRGRTPKVGRISDGTERRTVENLPKIDAACGNS